MRCFGLTAMAVLFCLSAPAQAELVVTISKSQQRLEVVVNGNEAYRWPVSTGRRGYTTPSGVYHPTRLERHWYSRKYDMSPMPWSVFFYRGYAMHGTMESYSLGHPASHGCVRLRPDNAAILFGLVRRFGAGKTKVVVMDGLLPQAPRAPQGVPMAEAAPPSAQGQARDHFAKATAEEGEQHLSARSHDAAHEVARANRPADEPREVRAPARTRLASVERYSVSHGDEAQVLRERAAWLRSLDRKYGFTR